MYSNELNSQQNAIARYTEGSILVLASDRSPQSSEETPGKRSHSHFSGKTSSRSDRRSCMASNHHLSSAQART